MNPISLFTEGKIDENELRRLVADNPQLAEIAERAIAGAPPLSDAELEGICGGLGFGDQAKFIDWLNDPTAMSGTTGHDHMVGGEGDDKMHGRSGHDYMDGGGGNDSMFGGDGNDDMHGGAGDDTMVGGDGQDKMYGGTGNDYMAAAEWTTADDKYMDGGEGDDTLYGGSGDDTLLGGEGSDFLDGGVGSDFLDGGTGNDAIRTFGHDTVHGGEGDDVIDLRFGHDEVTLVYGLNDGNDTVQGFDPERDGLALEGLLDQNGFGVTLEDGNTILTYGNTTITFEGVELTSSQIVESWVRGQASLGDGVTRVEYASSFMEGTDGNDVIQGSSGCDTIMGGDGDDIIRVWSGGNYLFGGEGRDVFVGSGFSMNVLPDFNPAEDKLSFPGLESFDQLDIQVYDGATTIAFGDTVFIINGVLSTSPEDITGIVMELNH